MRFGNVFAVLPLLMASANIVWCAPISSAPVLVTTAGVTLSNFTVLRTASAAVCTPADGGDLDVSVSPSGGLRIAGGMAAIGGSCDFLVEFDVQAPADLTLVGLAFNGAAAGNLSFAEVTETVRDLNGVIWGQTTVSSAGPLQSQIALPGGLASARVTKDILLVAGGSTASEGRASISFIDQEFNLAEIPQIPEPGSLVTLAIGLGALVWKVSHVT